MGILNVTPDSFADGGMHNSLPAAINRAQEMISEGVDIIDVGGESTRPGAARITEAEELLRTIPVIEAIAKSFPEVTISIDTTRANVALKALNAGAKIINDVSGGLADPKMAEVVANSGVKYVVMHWRGSSESMQSKAIYKDVNSEVIAELLGRVDSLKFSGVLESQIILDPGLGFAKLPEHNWEIIQNLEMFTNLGFPILIGASRKRFLGEELSPIEREAASIAITSLCAKNKIWGVRTHSVKGHKIAIDIVDKSNSESEAK
ncbi:MAG: dihydropteroate synthase [Actinobacteria bacterium]|uniref:dihydropteroate synthase n=1 Tax=freshwater metagenome TaxID=449393 RepID=A0A6J6MXS1_9ZZZZ|nr:dihydropteroate synthase [Actinomycetota bacterium]MSY04797.1 dihydropteroate synthase [Actinomycetota bacterium]MSY66970.1 dihydropteroate synthase [Actinomycetota bacterium]MSZ58757.1 dihydropteroate synthase [Actinomycetota bacterium]MTA01064.1 dihydropteroate synthase [Actinomycetota bacterium]